MVDGTRSTRTRRRMRSVFGSAQRFRGPRYLEERADPALAIWSSPTVLRAHLNDLIASDVRPCRVRDQAVDWKSAERNWGPVWPNIAPNVQSSWLGHDLSGFARIFDRFASGDISGVVDPTIRGDKLQAVQVQDFKGRSVCPEQHGRHFALLLVFHDTLNDVSGR